MQPQHAASGVSGARIMALFGDSITTDHISPAGAIKEASPGGQWLKENGVIKADFNSYGSRRGNHDVMMRGTFANVRIKNLMIPAARRRLARGRRRDAVPAGAGAAGEKMFIYDAAMKYIAEGTPTIVFGGEEYGTGSTPRLGRQGHAAARHQGGGREELRAHPPLATWSAWACCRCSSSRRRLVGVARHPRRRDLRHRVIGAELRPQQDATLVIHSRRRQPRARAADAAHRHADRGRLLQARRHPAVRAAAAARRVRARRGVQLGDRVARSASARP